MMDPIPLRELRTASINNHSGHMITVGDRDGDRWGVRNSNPHVTFSLGHTLLRTFISHELSASSSSHPMGKDYEFITTIARRLKLRCTEVR